MRVFLSPQPQAWCDEFEKMDIEHVFKERQKVIAVVVRLELAVERGREL
jgi:hypothetical protein